jgi:hypothetical protein
MAKRVIDCPEIFRHQIAGPFNHIRFYPNIQDKIKTAVANAHAEGATNNG